jgi:hypothetical protein
MANARHRYVRAEQTSIAERVGILLAVVEACLFGFVAALQFGIEVRLGGVSFAAPFLYPAAIVCSFLAVALLISVVVPGPSRVRGGRVLAAQIVVLIGMVGIQIGLMRGAALINARMELAYAVALVLAIASIVLVAAPLIAGLQRRKRS